MFHQLFSKPFAVSRHHSLPFANERQQYLLEEDRSQKTLEKLAHVLVSIAQHLPLQQSFITQDEIEVSAEAWSKPLIVLQPVCVGQAAVCFSCDELDAAPLAIAGARRKWFFC
jgi:hypothetical protein